MSTYIRETVRPLSSNPSPLLGSSNVCPLLHYSRILLSISAHTQSTVTEPKALTPEYARHEPAYGAVGRILHAIPHCVRVVHALFLFHRPFSLLPVSLPSLQELSLHGSLGAASGVDEEIQFASLNHLHIFTCYSPLHIFGTWRNSLQTSGTCTSLLWNIIPILSMN